jgi:hypothetical protein
LGVQPAFRHVLPGRRLESEGPRRPDNGIGKRIALRVLWLQAEFGYGQQDGRGRPEVVGLR